MYSEVPSSSAVAGSGYTPARRIALTFACAALLGCSTAPAAERASSANKSSASSDGAAAPVADGGGDAASANGPESPLLSVSDAAAQPSAAEGGSGLPDPDADCGSVTQMAETRLGPADIVWIIDGSPSMVDELAAVEQNITNFANTIAKAGIDHHVIMLAPGDVAANTPLGADPAHYLFVLAAVDSHNALSLLLDQYAEYAPFLRADASLHFVVVTDDDSFMAADDFRAQMQRQAGKSFLFHAIASESVDGLGCTGACGIPIACGAFVPGYEYYALADATGGKKISICTADWSMVFGPLQQAVIESAPLPCDYAIPAPPAGSSLDPDRVNVEVIAPSSEPKTLPRASDMDACADAAAWFYDDPTNPERIQMCPTACQTLSHGGKVQIKLGCATVSLD